MSETRSTKGGERPTPDEITIAVTVYSRRKYVCQAVASALNQTVPVKVMVVEDCGPDPGLREFVLSQFGSRIEYVRNPGRRGLFGNWNSCVENCRTKWLSILHDDDYLAPGFVESMVRLGQRVPGASLYFGGTEAVDDEGKRHPYLRAPEITADWKQVELEDFIWVVTFPYPGNLFRVDTAHKVGGFRKFSQYCGDWEMWSKLVAEGGGGCTRDLVAYQRQHDGADRGTNVVVRSGRQHPLSCVQHKRVLYLLKKAGRPRAFSRAQYQARYPIPTRFLLAYGGGLSPRLLNYHWRLLSLSPAPHFGYRSFQAVSRLLGPGFLRVVSNLNRRLRGLSHPAGNPATELGRSGSKSR